jgi:hypothetical protein
VKFVELLRSALERVVSARETIAYGNTLEAEAILEGLEVDLVAGLHELHGDEPRFTLADCNSIPSDWRPAA